MANTAETVDIPKDDLYEQARLVMSLLISLLIGVIAGIIAALSNLEKVLDKSVIIAFIAAGYVGTDFIEGFLRKERQCDHHHLPVLFERLALHRDHYHEPECKY